jgi:hypothetical protein
MIRDDFKGGIDTLEPAFRFLRTATNQRRWLVISGFEETSLSPSNRMLRIARNIRETTDCVLFVGDHASVGYERAIREGMPADCVFQAFGVREAAEILRRELRRHDLILLKGLGGHHLARIYFALEEERLGSVKCWRSTCEKKIICEISARKVAVVDCRRGEGTSERAAVHEPLSPKSVRNHSGVVETPVSCLASHTVNSNRLTTPRCGVY